MPVDEERLLAWIDGALAPADAAEVADAVAADPALTALAESHRGLTQRLRGGFDLLLHDPIPAALAAAVQPAATVTDLSVARRARVNRTSAPVGRFRLPQWAAIAATLAVGMMAGQMTDKIGPKPNFIEGGAGLQASGQLASALDRELASSPASGSVRVQVTFRAHSGQICRSWSAAGQDGVACHAGNRWQVMASMAAPAIEDGQYRMAGSSNPRLLGIIDGMISGEPFDAKLELQARQDGWR